MSLEPGHQLLHYRLIEKIGEGGMGVVWKARDTHLDRDVAVKILPANFAGDSERLARFEREAKLLAQLNHPNIAVVHGLDQDKSVRFLVMELVAGEDLARRLRQGPLPVEEALRVGLQVCEAMEAAHESGVIHRDLKPANIQLTPAGDIKVLDFGLAKAFDVAAPSYDPSMSPTVTSAGTMAGTILGTAAYMSPEQAQGRPVDHRADIWAFGCVLYELLTGRLAFQGESVSDTLASVLKFEPDHDSLPREVPRRVRRLLVRCLAKHPRQRLQAIGEARIALEECIAGTAEDVDDPSPARATKREGSLRIWTLVAALAVGVAAGGLAVWNMRPAAPRTITRFPMDLAGGLTMFGTVALSPDGRQLVYAANDQLYRHTMDRMLPRPIPGTEKGTHPFFSPDGSSIAFFTPTHLRRVDLDGSPPITLAEASQGVVGAWGEDGNLYYGQSGPFGLFRVAATGGSPETFVELGQYQDLDYPDILPGGKWLIYTALRSAQDWNNAQIRAKSIETGEDKLVIEGGHFARYVPTGHLVFGRSGTLFAVELDTDRAEATGVPVPVVEDVFLNGTIGGSGQWAVADAGTLVYVSRKEGERVLAIADRNGTVQRLDTPPKPYVHARVSPDGKRVVAQTLDPNGRIQMWLYELSGKTALRPVLQGTDGTAPVWSPDGQRLVFASKRDGKSGIWVQPMDGGTDPVLWVVVQDDAEYLGPQFSCSPDGRTLTFVRPGEQESSIWTVSEPGSEPELLQTVDGRMVGGPVFSPDGQWIAFWGSKGSAALTAAIHATPFPRTGERYTALEQDRFYPIWSPDGKEIFYSTVTGDLFSRSVSTTETFTFGPERRLPIRSSFAGRSRSFDIMPDGERLLVIVPSEDLPPRINVIVNWFEQLKERMAAR